MFRSPIKEINCRWTLSLVRLDRLVRDTVTNYAAAAPRDEIVPL
jgi:hypothetical protein